jgi:glucose-1-phosphate cytidylyltransferase
MYTVIFAGGYGTRLLEETRKVPKPMVKIGAKPILEHIINFYAKWGYKNFIILTGYKHEKIYEHFKKNRKIYSLNYLSNKTSLTKSFNNKISINFLYTGLNTNKLNRLKKVQTYLKNEESFFLTYGDGLSNINLKKLLFLQKKQKNICTLSAINPLPRFGLLKIKNKKVTRFEEKKIIQDHYVNGGFFVCDKKIFSYIKNSKNFDFEQNILSKLAKTNKLGCYKHHGFWYSMDTLRDKIYLNKLFKAGHAPWL